MAKHGTAIHPEPPPGPETILVLIGPERLADELRKSIAERPFGPRACITDRVQIADQIRAAPANEPLVVVSESDSERAVARIEASQVIAVIIDVVWYMAFPDGMASVLRAAFARKAAFLDVSERCWYTGPDTRVWLPIEQAELKRNTSWTTNTKSTRASYRTSAY